MSRRTSIAANPVLIGAATTLIVIVAVFLSYNANSGLPFVPTYIVKAEVPNAQGLIAGNDVRIGGARVGVVSRIAPLVGRGGAATAVLTLKLERDLPPLPADSTLIVRPRSPLGLKYVELTTGRSTRTIPDKGTLALAGAKPRPVEIDELFGMFDAPTRRASSTNLREFGTGFAGRGGDLNRAFRGLPPLALHAERGARNLADHGWDRLFPAFAQAAREVAPVAESSGRLFTGLNATFAALDDVRQALKDAISGGPEALDVATRELPAQARFIDDSTELLRRFRPGFASLAAASPRLASAFGAAEPALKRSPLLNTRLVSTLQAIETFASNERVMPGLQRLGRTALLLDPTVAFVTPAQTTCNYLALFFRNLSSALSESDAVGSMLRFSTVVLPQLPNSEAGPASAPAGGPARPLSARLEQDSFLHSNPYPNTAAPGQEHECEAGNEAYLAKGQVIGNPPGNQGVFSEKTERTP